MQITVAADTTITVLDDLGAPVEHAVSCDWYRGNPVFSVYVPMTKPATVTVGDRAALRLASVEFRNREQWVPVVRTR